VNSATRVGPSLTIKYTTRAVVRQVTNTLTITYNSKLGKVEFIELGLVRNYRERLFCDPAQN